MSTLPLASAESRVKTVFLPLILGSWERPCKSVGRRDYLLETPLSIIGASDGLLTERATASRALRPGTGGQEECQPTNPQPRTKLNSGLGPTPIMIISVFFRSVVKCRVSSQWSFSWRRHRPLFPSLPPSTTTTGSHHGGQVGVVLWLGGSGSASSFQRGNTNRR